MEREDVQELLASHPRSVVVEAVRRAVGDLRNSSAHGASVDWRKQVELHVNRATERSLRRVLNATGVVLHTNLGRAPLASEAIDAVADAAAGFTSLEYDLAKGERGSRYVHCVGLLRELTGAGDAIVVNNCASAMILALSALARDREVIVSRGELVEIGGSFRVPDIMERSGARLLEVGTTNRTHLDDYRRAISPRTGAIAKIHRSNFTQAGFVADVPVESLRPLAAEHDIPIVHDLGSGLMIDLSPYGLRGEPTAAAALQAGATVVLMSGDKLLGGPQAGIVVGDARAIARMRQDPFARAMRVDKMTLAALAATLELYRDPAVAVHRIPALAMLTASPGAIRERCERAAASFAAAGIRSAVVESTASTGAGAFPEQAIASFAVAIDGDPEPLEQKLRSSSLPCIGRIAGERLLLDMRSIPESDDVAFIAAVISALT
jgi:L-seryl-tRNA(Ser) seleniumtransferase